MRVVVIGAGIIGAACARELALRGADVIVVDRSAAASGTSAACEGNILVSDKTPGPELDLALAGGQRWVELAAELGADPRVPSLEYERKGGLVVATTPEGAASLAAFTATQRRCGIDAIDLAPEEALALEPDLTPAVVAAAHYPQDAQVQPTVAVEALLSAARAAGAFVCPHEPVVAAVLGPGGRIRGVRTGSGTHAADAVVNAAGPWAGEVARRLGVHLPVLPRRGMILVTTRMPPRVAHKVYDADYVGATQSADEDLQVSTVVESTAAGTVLIGSSRQRVGFDGRIDIGIASLLADRATSLFPFLSSAQLLRAYVGFRPYMPDHLPVIGPDPRRPGLFHVTGHEGAGIGLSLVSAELLAASVLGTPAPLDPRAFSVERASLAPHLQGVPA